MEEKKFLCTYCGASEIEEETSEYYICASCGTKVLKNKSDEFIQRIKSLNLESTTQQLRNYRELLNNSLKNKNVEFQNEICRDILNILPSDFQASFYNKFCNRLRYPHDYESFLQNVYLYYNKEEVEPYLEIMINNAKFNELANIEKLIRNMDLDSSYLDLLSSRKKKIDEEADLYANISRDVFICHSSKDIELLNKIVTELEQNQGFSTWYSERNMPWDPINYWENIKQAIKNCKVFLILITDNSKFSPDCKKELVIAKELNKTKRCAILAMDGKPGIEITSFLSETGSQWIDNKNSNALDVLAERIYNLKQLKESAPVQEKNIKQENNKQSNNSEVDSLLKRAFIFIEDEDWENARNKLENVLDKDPENAKAYLGELLINNCYKKMEDLSKLNVPLENDKTYLKIIKYGDEDLIFKMKSINQSILDKIKEQEEKEKQAELKRQQEAEQHEKLVQELKEAQELAKKKEEERVKEIHDLKTRFNKITFKMNKNQYLYFGSYPQSLVTSKTTLSHLEELSVNEDNRVVTYNNKKYYLDIQKNNKGEEVQKWYLVEPIRWKVIESKDGASRIISDKILNYYNNQDFKKPFNQSKIYDYLNNEFYNQWFDEKEKHNINQITKSCFVTLASKKDMDSKKYCEINIGSNVYHNRICEETALAKKVMNKPKEMIWALEDGLVNQNGDYITSPKETMIGLRPVLSFSCYDEACVTTSLIKKKIEEDMQKAAAAAKTSQDVSKNEVVTTTTTQVKVTSPSPTSSIYSSSSLVPSRTPSKSIGKAFGMGLLNLIVYSGVFGLLVLDIMNLINNGQSTFWCGFLSIIYLILCSIKKIISYDDEYLDFSVGHLFSSIAAIALIISYRIGSANTLTESAFKTWDLIFFIMIMIRIILYFILKYDGSDDYWSIGVELFLILTAGWASFCISSYQSILITNMTIEVIAFFILSLIGAIIARSVGETGMFWLPMIFSGIYTIVMFVAF